MKATLSAPDHRRLHLVLLLALSVGLLAPEATAAKPPKDKEKIRKADGDTTDALAGRREEKLAARGLQGSASDVEARQSARLRERLGVTDDDEWTVIAERIAKVEELRRSVAAGVKGGRGSVAVGDRPKRPARAGESAGSDFDALRSAVSDNYPDAEIKARLNRAHEAHQQREAQLLKAQADLRAVLSIRQEAMVVMMGLLPP